MGMNLLKKLGEYDGRTPEERAYAIINHVVDFFITAVIVVAMIIGGYSYYIYQQNGDPASTDRCLALIQEQIPNSKGKLIVHHRVKLIPRQELRTILPDFA